MAMYVDFRSSASEPNQVVMRIMDPSTGTEHMFWLDLVGLQELADLANAAVLQSRGFQVAHA
jgi:hypothetical protein